jgi:hypothetical protein
VSVGIGGSGCIQLYSYEYHSERPAESSADDCGDGG